MLIQFYSCCYSSLSLGDRNQKIKSGLYSLRTLSGLTSEWCPSLRLCVRAHTSRLQRWRVVGNVVKDLNLITKDQKLIPSRSNLLAQGPCAGAYMDTANS